MVRCVQRDSVVTDHGGAGDLKAELLHGTAFIVQELCESRGGCPGLSVLTSLLVSVDIKITEPCFGIGLSLSLIHQLTSEDVEHHFIIMVRHTQCKGLPAGLMLRILVL